MPTRAQAAQPMAMFCGLIILPAEVPSELAATSQVGSTCRVFAAWSWTLPKRTSLEVPEPVTKVPSAPSNGATMGYRPPSVPTKKAAMLAIMPE